MTKENRDLIIGALDSLGVALADHDHQWTEGERAVYEEALTTLWDMAEPAKLSGEVDASGNAHTPYQGASAPSQGAFNTFSEQLAAEYEKGRQHNDVAIAQPLREQLAAEREKKRDDPYYAAKELRLQLSVEREQHGEQLAAERRKGRKILDQLDAADLEISQLREQLAAEREKVKQLMAGAVFLPRSFQ
jgi:hypothetical protein